jgi:hypothetical protein
MLKISEGFLEFPKNPGNQLKLACHFNPIEGERRYNNT